ncbi:Protein ydgH precursor [Klebsiella pneumoniae ISC21]|nr:Protein ydgH precursor [Klebsiella pneumoniae ISC21]
MKLKNTLLASALLTTATLSAHAATELTPEQAAALKPYDRVVVTGRFNAIGDAVQAVSRKADKDGAASFYVVDTSDYGNGGNWRVTADLYKEDAPKADAPKNRIINGVMELPKDQAVELMPYDTVTVQGFYRSQPEVNDAITKAAKAKGAYAFFIVRQVDANQGGNQRITAYIYKKMLKNACCRARTLSRLTLKLAAQRWPKAAKRRRTLKFLALPPPPRWVRVPALGVSLRLSLRKVDVTLSPCRTALRSKK